MYRAVSSYVQSYRGMTMDESIELGFLGIMVTLFVAGLTSFVWMVATFVAPWF